MSTPKGEAVKNTYYKFKKAEKLVLKRNKYEQEQVMFVREIGDIYCLVVNAKGMIESVMILNLERSEEDEPDRTYQNDYAQSYIYVSGLP